MSDTQLISPWPMTVTVSSDPLVIVSITGISGNSYIVNGYIGLESPTTANEANAEAELPILWASPYRAPAPIPQSVTPLQVRRALNQAGLRSSVEAAIAAASQDARDAWEFASVINRDNPILDSMAAALGMSSAQVDQLFVLAASFE